MSRDFLTFIAWLLIIQWPLSVGATWFLWHLHQKSRDLDIRVPKPRVRLSLVMFVTGFIGTACSTVLFVGSVLYLTHHDDIVEIIAAPIYLAFTIAGYIPIINAAYLRWLEGQPLVRGRAHFETLMGTQGEPLGAVGPSEEPEQGLR